MLLLSSRLDYAVVQCARSKAPNSPSSGAIP